MTHPKGSQRTPKGETATLRHEHRIVRSTYQRLRIAGLTPAEAGNLTAHLNGLPPAGHGWTLEEIEGLLFVRALVDLGRVTS